MALRWVSAGTFRILDFDCEARPLSWIGGDYVSKEITAIGARWIGEPGEMMTWLLGERGIPHTREEFRAEQRRVFEGFREVYDEADMVVGHNILRYDLRALNAMYIESHLPPLGAKLAHDTYLHLVKRDGISASQKNLAEMLGVQAPKVEMSDPKWREANRLLNDGMEHSRRRVTGDVLQNIEMRARLLKLGYLKGPTEWRP